MRESPRPSRGEVWLVDLDPIRGREQGGRRPVLVISTNRFNHGRAGLVVVLPMTTTQRNLPSHVRIEPPEGGVRETSFIKSEDIRSLSQERLIERWGTVRSTTITEAEQRLRFLLQL